MQHRNSVKRCRRPRFARTTVHHVSLRTVDTLPRLRTHAGREVLERALTGARDHTRVTGFRVLHYALEGNHLHLIVEADDDTALSRGMKGLAIRLARGWNKAFARREPDLRGHTGVRGWAHAAAHTADLLKFLAREPTFTDADRASILDGVAALVVRRHGAIFHHGEDGRLAQPVLEAVRRGISPAAIDAWLQVIAAPLGEPALAEFEPGQYAAQRNARNLLFTLFVQLALDPAPAGQAAYLRDKLRVLLGG